MSDPQSMEGPPVAQPQQVQYQPLKGIPFPPLLVGFFIVVALAFAFALSRTPHAFSRGIDYERGNRAFQQGDMVTAAKLLAPISAEFPMAKSIRMDLAEAYARSGQIENAIRELRSFEGTMVNNEDDARLNSIADIVDQKAKEAGK